MALTVAVDLPAADREVLEPWKRASTMPAGPERRGPIVLLAGQALVCQ